MSDEATTVTAPVTPADPVTAATTALAQAEAALAKAKSDHADTVATAQRATLDAAVKGKHVIVEAVNGTLAVANAPTGYDGAYPDRVISLSGRDYHHVGTDAKTGIWIYRSY